MIADPLRWYNRSSVDKEKTWLLNFYEKNIMNFHKLYYEPLTIFEIGNLNTISDFFEYVNSREDFYECCNEYTTFEEYLSILEIILLRIMLWISKKKKNQNYNLSISLSEISLFHSYFVADIQWSQWSLHQKQQYDTFHWLHLRLLNDYVKQEVKKWFEKKKMVVSEITISNFHVMKNYFQTFTEIKNHKSIVKLLLNKLSEYRLHVRICVSFVLDLLYDVRKLLAVPVKYQANKSVKS